MKLVALAFGVVSTVAVAASGELVEDGAPVADAWLVATRSECRGLAHCTTSCVELKVARTDKAGRYALASGARSINDYRLLLYRPGGRLGEYRDSRGNAQRYPDMDPATSRIAHLALIAGHMSCSGAPQNERAALLPVYRAMFAEARALASEPEQQRRARQICRLMYWASLPSQRAPLSSDAEAAAQTRYLQKIEPACNEELPQR